MTLRSSEEVVIRLRDRLLTGEGVCRMPGTNLTAREVRERSRLVSVDSYDIVPDLTGAGDTATFPVGEPSDPLLPQYAARARLPPAPAPAPARDRSVRRSLDLPVASTQLDEFSIPMFAGRAREASGE
ncbi:hypothetical protein ABZW18_05890 [Streptomyces sp. NPDC004647]|uniref:hypothetical protein n=1 Tax=Streptomyces sp. NPDC004647 TaxID=3154671 RepID=UPI00339F249A